MFVLFLSLAGLLIGVAALFAFRWLLGQKIGKPWPLAILFAVLAALETGLIFAWIYPQSLPLPEELVEGTWRAYNLAEPEMIGEWTFEPGTETTGAEDQLVVDGPVYALDDLRHADDRSVWKQIETLQGPYPIRLAPRAGRLDFAYDHSEWGKGDAHLKRARGFIGQYVDDETTPEAERDSGWVVLYPEEGRRVEPLVPSLRRALLLTLLAGALPLGLSLAVGALVRRLGPLAGISGFLAIGLFYLLFLGAGLAGSRLTPEADTLSSEGLPGVWIMEYLEDRTRLGKVHIRGQDKRLLLDIRLIFREGYEEGGVADRDALAGAPLTYDPDTGRLSFDYSSKVGNGTMTLEAQPVLLGGFQDQDAPDEGATYGDFVLIQVARE